jgi:23S rRNA (uracil1939-C5)-methyltransferase
MPYAAQAADENNEGSGLFQRPHPGDRITLTIDRLAYDGGRGVGRHQGLVVFVAETAPQDKVEVEITDVKKNFAVGQLISVLRASPQRRPAPCPYAGHCGGCDWQHVTYEEQARQKKAMLEHTLKEFSGCEMGFIAAPEEFRYRNRIQLQVRGRDYGFFAKNSRDLVAITDCLIAEPELLQNFTLPLGSGPKIELAQVSGKIVVRDLEQEPSQFTQVNRRQNLALQNTVVEFLSVRAMDQALDLYCGDGNLSFALLSAFPRLHLVGVEASHDAVIRARSTAERSEFKKRSEFVVADTAGYLRAVKKCEAAMILDPPRPGLGPAVCKEILRLRPPVVIYVSCNLGTLGRDLRLVSEHYTLKRAVGIDMFPQTSYIEAVCLLLPRD